jgi:nucleoid-associated protein YgaU
MDRFVVIAATVVAVVLAGAFLLFDVPGWFEQPQEPVSTPQPTPATPGAPQAAIPLTPTFDIVRVDPSGTSVIAGRAAPLADVTIIANGEVIGHATANEKGDWVAYVETPLKQGNQELTLTMKTPEGKEIKGEQSVVVAVPSRPGEVPLVVLGEGDGSSRILQSPTGDSTLPLALEAVDYDEKARVVFSGRAVPNATVRLYIDNQFIAEVIADANGRWVYTPTKPIIPGVHSLRLDQVTRDGKVHARVEIPFERATPEGVVMLSGKIVVQPGNNLWRIARQLYGTGFRYTEIYDANKEQIRNPDLIYPGQIFAAPDG